MLAVYLGDVFAQLDREYAEYEPDFLIVQC